MAQLDDIFNLDNIKKAMELVGEKNQTQNKVDDTKILEKAKYYREENNIKNFLDLKFPDDSFDNDMDRVADSAFQKAEDLYDIASQQVDARHIGDVASSSAKFLEIMLNAKSAKTKRKMDLYQIALKERDLTLKEKKLERELNEQDAPEVIPTNDMCDRNELLKSFNNPK